MKAGIHPEYQETTIRCACGSELKTRSTRKEIRVEICSSCHPFFTGTQKIVDTEGRVERFRKKYAPRTAPAAAPAPAAPARGRRKTASPRSAKKARP